MCAAVVPAITTFAKSAIGKAVIGAVATTAATRLLSPNRRQQQPSQAPAIIPKQNAPRIQPAAPMQAQALDPENIRPEDEEIRLSQNKKQRKKLERKTLGVKSLAAVQPPTESAPMGINPGSYA
tara:strand:+ start:444 stop:815 length:372 start_codon:yes stop_codon:yes gene_type:complete